MKPLYIFDLDGTLADIKHRRHFVEDGNKQWHAFFEACIYDTPIWPVIHTLYALRDAGAEVWIYSGRSDQVRRKTELWLSNYTLPYNNLRMRTAGDYTPDHLLKKQWYDEMSDEDRARLVAVFDDRNRIVQMWRDQGVTCFQVAEGNF